MNTYVCLRTHVYSVLRVLQYATVCCSVLSVLQCAVRPWIHKYIHIHVYIHIYIHIYTHEYICTIYAWGLVSTNTNVCINGGHKSIYPRLQIFRVPHPQNPSTRKGFRIVLLYGCMWLFCEFFPQHTHPQNPSTHRGFRVFLCVYV